MDNDTERVPSEAGEGAGELSALLREDARLQSQFDRLVSKALNTARGNWERERGERETQPAQDRERELERREQALRQRELRAEAAALLHARGLPGELLDCVPLGDENGLEQGVEKVGQAFRQSVDSALTARLRGAPPKSGEGAPAPNDQLRRAMGLKTNG